MRYLKVKWIHEFKDEPVWIYGELSNEMGELRKIDVFPDGKMGYTELNAVSYISFPSEEDWPSKTEIESDPQFQVFLITQQEFEDLWEKAISQNNQV